MVDFFRIFVFANLLVLNSLVAAETPKIREWTILVYAGGDEVGIYPSIRAMLKRFQNISSLTPTSQVNLIAQHDDFGKDDNFRYSFQFHRDALPGGDLPNPADIVAQLGEQDSSHPLTLKRFLRWGVQNYPARHYILIMAGHSWGQRGLIQDFYTPEKGTVEHASMIRNYEFRRILEEIYRENGNLIPEGKFDLLFVDACIYGQLEMAIELKDVFRYFAASTIDVPDNSLPYDVVLEPFIQHINQHPNEARGQADDSLENLLLKPLVRQYVAAHVRGGSLVKPEGDMDPVQAFALRTEKVPVVAQALTQFVSGMKSLPETFRRDWRNGLISTLTSIQDMDYNADLLMLGRAFEQYFREQRRKTGDAVWESLDKLNLALRETFGYPVIDPTILRTRIVHPTAMGAWVTAQIDESAGRSIAVCNAIRTYIMLNLREPSLVPTLKNKKGEILRAASLDCFDLRHAFKKAGGKADDPAPIRTRFGITEFFDVSVIWPEASPPSYLLETPSPEIGDQVGYRSMAFWIPKIGASLHREVLVRLAGTNQIDISYLLSGPPEGCYNPSLGEVKTEPGESLKVDSFFLAEDTDPRLKNAGLYVIEGHTNATLYKRGLGIFLRPNIDPNDANMNGRLPIEREEEKLGRALTLEEYFDLIAKDGERDLQGEPFYRAHRITETGWPDFLFQ